VLVRYLSSDAATEPMSVKIYNSARSSPTPASTRSPASCWRRRCWPWPLGTLVYRSFTRGERGQESAVGELAAQV
jgi:spermidine/putrescine transport system permease protein